MKPSMTLDARLDRCAAGWLLSVRVALVVLSMGVICGLAATGAAFAQANAQTLYKVTGVAPRDVLNVRSAPAPEAPVIASIARDATGLTRSGRTAQSAGTLWAEIGFKGVSGWVAARYLLPDMGATAKSQPNWRPEVKAEPREEAAAPAFGSATRVALVIGNGRYPIDSSLTQLMQAPNDARDLGAALKAQGFDVIQVLDADLVELRRGLADFKTRSTAAEVGVVFYGGHALQLGDETFLLPISSRIKKVEDLKKHALPLAELLMAFGPREPKQAFVLLDASRDNRLVERLGEAARKAQPTAVVPAKGLGRPVSVRGGMTVAYAAEPGAIAPDSTARNSQFVDALLTNLKSRDRSIASILAPSREAVQRASNGRQAPWFEELAAPAPRPPAAPAVPGRRRPLGSGAAAAAEE